MVVYTCIFGRTDPLRIPTVRDPTVRYVCFTDSQELIRRRGRGLGGWELIPVPPEADTRLQSRRVKILAHVMFSKVQHSLWLDAAYRLQTMPRTLLTLLDGVDFLAMRHPHRNRIRDEAEAIIQLGLAPETKIRAQLALYQSQGFDTDTNPQQAITSTGFLLRRHCPRTALFEERWWQEVSTHTYRDQMSIDFVIRETEVRAGYIPGHYKNNPYAKWHTEPRELRRSSAAVRYYSDLRPAAGVRPVRKMDGATIRTNIRVGRLRRRFTARKMLRRPTPSPRTVPGRPA